MIASRPGRAGSTLDRPIQYSLCDEQGDWLGDDDKAGKPKQQAIGQGDFPAAVVGRHSPVGTATSSDQKRAYIEADNLTTPRDGD